MSPRPPVPVASEGILSPAIQAKLNELDRVIEAEIAAAKDPVAQAKIFYAVLAPKLDRFASLLGAVPQFSGFLPIARTLKAQADQWILRGGNAA